MATSKVHSLSDADARLAALNTEILALEMERSALLAAELENAKARVEEIRNFIGVYQASSVLGEVSAPRRRTAKKRAAKKGSAKKKAGRVVRPAGKALAGAKKKRTRGNNAERVGSVTALVKGSGKDGISARRVAKETGFPYGAVLKILNSSADYKKVGEKRDRRYFMK